MAKISKIEIEIAPKKTISVSEDEARALYETLKKLFETKTVTLYPPYIPPVVYHDSPYKIWYTNGTTSTDCKISTFRDAITSDPV